METYEYSKGKLAAKAAEEKKRRLFQRFTWLTLVLFTLIPPSLIVGAMAMWSPSTLTWPVVITMGVVVGTFGGLVMSTLAT